MPKNDVNESQNQKWDPKFTEWKSETSILKHLIHFTMS